MSSTKVTVQFVLEVTLFHWSSFAQIRSMWANFLQAIQAICEPHHLLETRQEHHMHSNVFTGKAMWQLHFWCILCVEQLLCIVACAFQPWLLLEISFTQVCVCVGDLQKCLEKLVTREGTYDLHKLLLNGSLPSWKTAPDATYLSSCIAPLCQDLFKVAPNGVLASTKLKSAVEKLASDKKKRLNFSHYSDKVFLDKVGSAIRIACSQYRDLKRCGSKYATCIRKASLSEKNKLMQCLGSSTWSKSILLFLKQKS